MGRVQGKRPILLVVSAGIYSFSLDTWHTIEPQLTIPSALKAKQAIADALVIPLAKLPREQLDALDVLLSHTLRKSDVFEHVRLHITPLDRVTLESTLTRHGYSFKVVADLVHVRPTAIRSFLQGRLSARRAQELREEMLAAGMPL